MIIRLYPQYSLGRGLPSALPKCLGSPYDFWGSSLCHWMCVEHKDTHTLTEVLWTQICCQNTEFQSLWGTWYLNEETKCLSLDNSTCCINIPHFGCTRESRKTCLDMKCQTELDKLQQCSREMKDLQFAGGLLGRSRGLSAFEQQICHYLLKLLPSDCSCYWPLWNIQKLACCTVVIRKY